MNKKCYAIIVAGGSGERFGGDTPKQFCDINGKPVLWYAAEPFLKLSFEVEIIIVLPAKYIEYWKELCLSENIDFKHKVVQGGITRFHSVKNALKCVDDQNSVVAVHDGVRPLITNEFVESLFVIAQEKGSVVPVIKPTDSMRSIDGSESRNVDRSKFVFVQTPQVFLTDILLDAYRQAYLPEFTDDATVVQSAGNEIFLAEGLARNIKITRQEDLEIAKILISAS